MIEPVRPIELADIEAARERIAATVLRTPLVKLDLGPGGPDVRLKLENLQPTNSYKIRGAANAVAKLSPEEKALGVQLFREDRDQHARRVVADVGDRVASHDDPGGAGQRSPDPRRRLDGPTPPAIQRARLGRARGPLRRGGGTGDDAAPVVVVVVCSTW